jgi:hypothetical protein
MAMRPIISFKADGCPPLNSGVRPLMKLLVILLSLFPIVASASDLVPVKKPELAAVLGLLEVLATTPPDSNQPYIVRVYAAPTSVNECDGTVGSCPDVRLFVTVSNGDLGETPVLYQLPMQKGWEFKGWVSPVAKGGRMASFTVRTTLPEANIELAARKAWRSVEYRVFVSPESASYVRR